MDLKFQQSEPIAARRRWILVLVQDADATAGLTGATGQVYISKNGAAGVLSTNSLVEIDSTNMPGQYYVELTAGELSDLGWISIYKKTASSKPFEDRGFVSYDDPAARHGGFAVGGSSKSGGLTKTQAKALLEDIRTIVQEELAKDEVEDDAEEKDYTDKLDQILVAVNEETPEPEPLDLSPVLEAIDKIKPAKDYSKELTSLKEALQNLSQMKSQDMTVFNEAMLECQKQMESMSQSMSTSVSGMAEFKAGFEQLQSLMAEYGKTLNLQTDMEARFAKLDSRVQDETMQKISQQIEKLIQAMTFVLKRVK